MTMRSSIRKRSRGQSAVEFALMMPVIMAFFFYVFEANIQMSAMHQASWASYASARGFLVEREGRGRPEDIMPKILTGRIFQDAPQRPSVIRDQDGVRVTIGAMESLPYMGKPPLNLLQMAHSDGIPTHLGRNEWSSPWDQGRESIDAPPRQDTDNNPRDH